MIYRLIADGKVTDFLSLGTLAYGLLDHLDAKRLELVLLTDYGGRVGYPMVLKAPEIKEV